MTVATEISSLCICQGPSTLTHDWIPEPDPCLLQPHCLHAYNQSLRFPHHQTSVKQIYTLTGIVIICSK